MRKIFILQVIALLSSLTLRAQHKQQFDLDTPAVKVKNSHYNAIKLIDIRNDTTNIGFVQTGMLNRKALVVPGKPLANQLSGLLNRITDSSAMHNELLVELRQFSFAEMTGAMSEKGYCYLRAGLYTKVADKYQLIDAVDTIVQVKGMVDVTKALLKTGGGTLCNFITDNLLKQPKGTEAFTTHEILNIDSVEKSRIKLYNVSGYKDGLYTTYKQFMNQEPDKQIVVDGYEIYPDAVRAKDKDNKLRKVKSQSIYAIVYNGQPYIASRDEYSPLKKVGNDFLFTGNAKVSPSMSEQVTASMMLGLLGSLMVSNNEGRFEMKIDHKNGSFIKLKEIIEPEKPAYNE